MKKLALAAGAFLALGILATLFATAPAEAKEGWSCNTKATTTTCSLGDCGIAVTEPGKVGLWTTGRVAGLEIFYFAQISNGRWSMQQWTNLSDTGQPVPADKRVDIFARDCAEDGQLKDLSSEMQDQFMGMYGIPAPPAEIATAPSEEGGAP